jgi:RNA polymerase sigma-32 factor
MVLAARPTSNELRDGFSVFLSLAARHHPITPAEEQALARRMHDRDDKAAAEQLMLANLRYVVKVALEYRTYGCDLNELVQAGNLGLAEAVRRFDPDRGTRLVTYASWWIRDAIRQCIARSRSVSARGTTRAERKLLGSSSAPDAPKRDVSLDTVRATDLPWCNGAEESVIYDQETERLKIAVSTALRSLDRRERAIARWRFLADRPRSLADIGEEFGVSRERARQIAERARKKLRKKLRAAGFSEQDLPG